MNAMNFISNDGCAKHWRIRHGAADRDTSFAISAMLAQCLTEEGKEVDYFLPWGVPHSGDYDLESCLDELMVLRYSEAVLPHTLGERKDL